MNEDLLKNAISPYIDYCEGYGNNGASGNSYILGITLGAGVSDIKMSHNGSQLLDEIISFDRAETDGVYIGQLNMSHVSSFCGPQGLIWGYDIVKNDSESYIKTLEHNFKKIKVYSADCLIEATKKLFGTVNEKRFILKPGSHVPFAGKAKYLKGPCELYSGIAVGIPLDRKNNACLLMEDVGIKKNLDFVIQDSVLIENLVRSVVEVGINQNIDYSACFVSIKKCIVQENRIGCSLVAAPYFTLAKNAFIKNNLGVIDPKKMFTVTLDDWENLIFKK